MPKTTLPAMADRAVWEKLAKGRAGIRWDSVVEKAWRDIGGNEENTLSIEKFAGYKTEEKERRAIKERVAVTSKVKEEEHLEIYLVRRFKIRYMNET